MQTPRLAVRWTIGDVSDRGFAALRLSLRGAWRVFGPAARYVVGVNSLPVAIARERTGEVPDAVEWRACTGAELPDFLRPHLDPALSEGTSWKLSPLRLFPDHYELSLDNDCILWSAPAALRTWLDGAHAGHALFAADVWQCAGQFADLCGPEPRNSGIRGLPPGFDYERALRDVLAVRPVPLRTEQDEQGLQAAALMRALPLLVVETGEVSICSPFPPHQPHPGRCGAHFVGLNARVRAWDLDGRNAAEHTAQHWDRWQEELEWRVGGARGGRVTVEPSVTTVGAATPSPRFA